MAIFAQRIVLERVKINYMHFIFLPVYIEIIVLSFGILYYQRMKKSPFKLLVWLLLIVVIAESIGGYQRRILHIRNVEVYNISTCIEFITYGYLFWTSFSNKKLKLITKYFIIIYPIIWLINILFIQGFHVFHTYTMTIGSIYMILFSCLIFYEIFISNKKINLFKSPIFWLSTGLLFFYAGDLINGWFVKFTHKIKFNILDFTLFKLINNSLIFILYFTFIKIFQCFKIQKK